jgi:uncharacterized membrane protein
MFDFFVKTKLVSSVVNINSTIKTWLLAAAAKDLYINEQSTKNKIGTFFGTFFGFFLGQPSTKVNFFIQYTKTHFQNFLISSKWK